MKYSATVQFLLLAMLVIGVGVYHLGRGMGAPARQSAPIDFTMTDTNNQPVTLSSFRGKVVVVEIFATWCHNCANERPGLIDLQKKANDDNLPLQIIGIASSDTSRDTIRAYVTSNGINYPVVFTDQGQMAPFGTLTGYPTNFIIDKEGKIVDTMVGFVDEQTLNNAVKKYM